MWGRRAAQLSWRVSWQDWVGAEAAAELANRYGQSLIACTFLSSV